MAFKKNTKVLIIDRGWLEKQTLYEETFLSYLSIFLDRFEDKLIEELGTRIHFETISVMKEINNGRIFEFIDDEGKVKEQKMKNYLAIEKEFPGYAVRFSTDVIKKSSKDRDLNTLYVFLVYTESDEEIDIIKRRYDIRGILRFDKESSVNEKEKNIRYIYINSINDCVKMSKQMIPFLFQDVIKNPMLFS